MTTVLIILLWIGYGIFLCKTTKVRPNIMSDIEPLYSVLVIFAPLFFIWRCLVGNFWITYDDRQYPMKRTSKEIKYIKAPNEED